MPLNPSSSLAQLFDAPVRPGHVVWLGIRPGRRDELIELQSADFDVVNGVLGDRYTRAQGARQVTLIQVEHLGAIASHLGRTQVLPGDMRRNVVTQGMNLLALKQKRFRIGSALLQTTGDCHPCSRMEEIFGLGGYNAVRGLGGITARVIESGTVRVRDDIVALPADKPPQTA